MVPFWLVSAVVAEAGASKKRRMKMKIEIKVFNKDTNVVIRKCFHDVSSLYEGETLASAAGAGGQKRVFLSPPGCLGRRILSSGRGLMGSGRFTSCVTSRFPAD